jgi:hypothetical protein
MTIIKSDIKEAKDQLFLDSSDGQYLTALSSNFGINRPKFGMSDDNLWRAIVRQLALDYKQIITVFYELLSDIFGPQRTVGTSLKVAALTGDMEIQIYNWELLPQRGTLILDKGLLTEESVVYTFCDPNTGLIQLQTTLKFNHAVLGNRGVSFLASNAVAPAGSITVEDGTVFPNPGVVGPFPVLIEAEDINKNEVVICSFKVGNVLTVTNTVNDHSGPISQFAVTPVTNISENKMLIFGGNLSAFDEEGILYIQQSGGTPSEYVSYSSMSLADKTFDLKSQLVNSYALTGTGDSISAPVIGDQTLIDAGAAFTPSIVGLSITMSGSINPVNNGVFTITTYVSPTSIKYTNPTGVIEALFTGKWYIPSVYATKAKHGSSVQLAQVLVEGVDWDIFQTEYYVIKLLIPDYIVRNRLVDAPFLHDRAPTPPSSTLSANVLAGGTTLLLVNATNFPDSGIVRIDATGTPETISYSRINRFRAVLQNTDNAYAAQNTGDSITLSGGSMILVKSGANFTTNLVGLNVTISGAANAGNNGTFPITAVTPPNTLTYTNAGITESPFLGSWFITGFQKGATTLFVDNVRTIKTGFDTHKITSIDVGYGTVNSELVNIVSIDPINNSISVSATTKIHVIGESIVAGDPNLLFLDRPLLANHGITKTVALYRVYLPGTTIECGCIYTADKSRFQGKYLWSFLERVAESTKTTLAENVSGPTYVVVGQQAGRTALEVHDASFFNTIDFSSVLVGDNLASREEVQINDITLRTDILGRKLFIPAAVGGTSLHVLAGPNFPEASGYRVFVRNTMLGPGTGEEVVVVKAYTPDPGIPPVGGVLALEGTLAYNHLLNETVELMSDVLTVDSLTNDQEGVIPYAQRTGLVPMIGNEWATPTRVSVGPLNIKPASVQELRSYVNVVSAFASQFDANGDYLKINFGRNKLDASSQLALDYVAGVSSITVVNGSSLPSSNFWIVIGEGTREYEFRNVISRIGNTLNLTKPTSVIHRKYEWVTFYTGHEEEVYYNSKTTGGGIERFNFDPPIPFDNYHQSNEVVAASRLAWPSKTGSDWPFYLPSTWKDRFEFIFDLARAAGVKVVIVHDR